jgi:hypothetical protein
MMCGIDAAKKPFMQEEVIVQYKRLIASMPGANQYLLLYVLDLLTVFARKVEKNRMNASSEWGFLYPFFRRRLTILFVVPFFALFHWTPASRLGCHLLSSGA